MRYIRKSSKRQLRDLAIVASTGIPIKVLKEGDTGGRRDKNGEVVKWLGRVTLKQRGKRKFMNTLEAALLHSRNTAMG